MSSLVAWTNQSSTALFILMFSLINMLALMYSERRPSYGIMMKGIGATKLQCGIARFCHHHLESVEFSAEHRLVRHCTPSAAGVLQCHAYGC